MSVYGERGRADGCTRARQHLQSYVVAVADVVESARAVMDGDYNGDRWTSAEPYWSAYREALVETLQTAGGK